MNRSLRMVTGKTQKDRVHLSTAFDFLRRLCADVRAPCL
jgi:hypothetical protein